MNDKRNPKLNATAQVRALTCGCCTNGCTCANHQDTPNGRPPKRCGIHAAAPRSPSTRRRSEIERDESENANDDPSSDP